MNNQCEQFEEEQIPVLIGDQNAPLFLRSIVDGFETLAEIIDKGCHCIDHFKNSL